MILGGELNTAWSSTYQMIKRYTRSSKQFIPQFEKFDALFDASGEVSSLKLKYCWEAFLEGKAHFGYR